MVLRENVAFRRLFLGRLVTNAGDSLYLIASMWLVYELTGSTLYTGVAGFLLMVPQAFQFLTGPLVDRWRARRILVGTQAIQGVLVLVVPLAWWLDQLTVWLLLGLIPLLSMLNQFVYPTLNAVLPRLVEREELAGANAAFAAAYQGVDMAFNAIGGIVIALVGAVTLFLLDAVTFAAALVLFAGVNIPRIDSQPGADGTAVDGGRESGSYRRELATGVAYIRGTLLVPIVLSVTVANFAIGVTFAVLPGFADLRGGPAFYGLLMGAIAGGILVGAVVAPRLSGRSFGRLVVTSFPVAAGLWLAALLVPWTAATLALALVSTIAVGVYNVGVTTIRQTVVPDHLLGRVSSVSASAAGAATPVGALLGGLAGEALGIVPVAMTVSFGILAMWVLYLAIPGLRGLPAVDRVEPADLNLPAAPAS